MKIILVRNNLRVHITEKFTYKKKDLSDVEPNCFKETKKIFYGAGFLKLWNCSNPNPIGRLLIVYRLSQRDRLAVKEIIAFGRLLDPQPIYLKSLPLVKTTLNQNFEYGNINKIHKMGYKAIDNNFNNIPWSTGYNSCIFIHDEIEAFVSIDLDNSYFISRIIVQFLILKKSGETRKIFPFFN